MTDLRERLRDAIGVLDTDPAMTVFADWLREHALIRDAIVAYEWTDPRTGEKRLLDPAEVTVVVRP